MTLNNLTAAQTTRTAVRKSFFRHLVSAIVALIAHPETLETTIATITAKSEDVSASLDDTDLALINTVTGIVWAEQSTRAEQVAALQAQIDALKARLDAQ